MSTSNNFSSRNTIAKSQTHPLDHHPPAPPLPSNQITKDQNNEEDWNRAETRGWELVDDDAMKARWFPWVIKRFTKMAAGRNGPRSRSLCDGCLARNSTAEKLLIESLFSFVSLSLSLSFSLRAYSQGGKYVNEALLPSFLLVPLHLREKYESQRRDTACLSKRRDENAFREPNRAR